MFGRNNYPSSNQQMMNYNPQRNQQSNNRQPPPPSSQPPPYGGHLAHDYNGDGLITEADFVLGARMRGWGPIGEDVARSAFRSYDKNRNGFLDAHDVNGAYTYIYRLYVL